MTIEIGLTHDLTNTQYAPLAALSAHYQQNHTLEALEQVQMAMKKRDFSPADKLKQVFLSILAGCETLSEVNTRLKAEVGLAAVWGWERFADQSTLSRTLDGLTLKQIASLRQATTAIWRAHSANYGYTYAEVPQRTRQREWDQVQAKVVVTQSQLSQHQQAIHNLRHQLGQLQHHFSQQHTDLERCIVQQRHALRQRQLLGQPTQRCRNRLQRLRKELAHGQLRFQKRQRCLLSGIHQHQTHSGQLRRRLAQRCAARDAIDTETLCRERHLEKDQIMLDLQILLANLHDWVKQHFFAPEWQRLSLEKAIPMIYRKSGRVIWHQDRIQVVLDSYTYHDQQQAMQVTCQRFNAANLRWRDGRLLRITVRQQGEF